MSFRICPRCSAECTSYTCGECGYGESGPAPAALAAAVDGMLVRRVAADAARERDSLRAQLAAVTAERDQARMEAHRVRELNQVVDVNHVRLRDGLRRALDTWSAHLGGLEKRLVGGPDGGTRAERAAIAELRKLVQS